MPNITISDVAREAGVSMKTVSRVLNREPHVRQQVQERVLAAVKSLDYRPNASARALAGSKSYLLGLYINNPSRTYVSQVEYGAMRACRGSGHHLVVEELSGSAQEVREHLKAMHAAVQLDGVILTPPITDDAEILAVLKESKVPFVCIAPSPTGSAQPAAKVFMDDKAAARDMTRYLLDLEHRDIAFIAGPATHAAAGQRLDGYMTAMADAGIAPSPGWIRRSDFTFRGGLEAGEHLLKGTKRPTAIFAANDDMALGVMTAAHRMQMDLPGKLSIVGFDDSPSAEVVWPRLTTVRQPTEEMAFEATLMVIRMGAADSSAEVSLELDFRLVIRDSAAPPS